MHTTPALWKEILYREKFQQISWQNLQLRHSKQLFKASLMGTVHMLDYMQQKPITLNFKVHFRYCAAKDNLFVFSEISPQTYANDVWKDLTQLWLEFDCNKPEENE